MSRPESTIVTGLPGPGAGTVSAPIALRHHSSPASGSSSAVADETRAPPAARTLFAAAARTWTSVAPAGGAAASTHAAPSTRKTGRVRLRAYPPGLGWADGARVRRDRVESR